MDRFAIDPRVYAASVKQSTSPLNYNLDKAKFAYCLDISQMSTDCTENPMSETNTCQQQQQQLTAETPKHECKCGSNCQCQPPCKC
jgi:hypothetical protein